MPPSKPLTLRAAALAMRPWSFTATVSPVALGTVLARRIDGAFAPGVLALTLLVTLPVHGAGNLLNTYGDFQSGCDGAESSDQTLVSGRLLPAHVLRLARGCLVTSALALVPLLSLTSLPLLPSCTLYVLGVLGATSYTGGPALKYKALGDLLIMLTFGPVLIMFAYAMQSGRVAAAPLLLTIAPTVHIEAILHGNNLRDMKEDARNGVLTLALLIGRGLSVHLYALLVVLPYCIVGAQACMLASPARALPLLTAALAMPLVRGTYGGHLHELPRRTAKMQFAFGVLYAVSLAVCH